MGGAFACQSPAYHCDKKYYFMESHSIFNDFLRNRKDPRYLEIGVLCGWTFFEVDAWLKVGVDPIPQFDLRNYYGAYYEARVRGKEMFVYPYSSDDFFAKKIVGFDSFDLIFVDGMHEHLQCWRDMRNGMTLLKDDGLMYVHDVNPKDSLAVTPFSELYAEHLIIKDSREWNGDIYKCLVWLDAIKAKYSTILDVSEGLAVLPKQTLPDSVVGCDLSYEYYDANREKLLGKHI